MPCNMSVSADVRGWLFQMHQLGLVKATLHILREELRARRGAASCQPGSTSFQPQQALPSSSPIGKSAGGLDSM